MTHQTLPAHRYSPKPIEGYSVQIGARRLGPASLRMLLEPEVWNLAWLGYNYEANERHPFHPDPTYAVHCWHSAWTSRQDGSQLNPHTSTKGESLHPLLRGSAVDFVHFLSQWEHTRQLPLYRQYGPAWLALAAKRARLARLDNASALLKAIDAAPADLAAAQALLERFRNPK